MLWDDAKGRCSEAVSAWLPVKGARWRVLEEMREKKREAAPSCELTWRSIAEMATGPEPVLLAPGALGSRSNSRLAKSVIGETDVSSLAAATAFDMRWIKVLNGRSPSSVALHASATPRPCPGAVRDASCLCHGLDTPAHLFGDDHPSCPLAVHEPIFRQMLASLWFRCGVPLLGCAPVGPVPLEVRSAVGYRSGFVAAVKPARDAIPLLLVQEAAAYERFQVRRDKVEEHQSTTVRRAGRRLQKQIGRASV